jgi:hypothetical protein
MESKLNALLVIVLFIALSFIGLMTKLVLKIEFDVKIYFWYLMLLSAFLIFFGRPIVLIALDLIKIPYRENEKNFPLPGDHLNPSSPKKPDQRQS